MLHSIQALRQEAEDAAAAVAAVYSQSHCACRVLSLPQELQEVCALGCYLTALA
jgi:hypothetical protein